MVAVAALALPAAVSSAAAQPPGPARFTATAVAPASSITVAKSTSGRLAETDRALLDRSDPAPVALVVKLDYDAAARYTGAVKGLAPTSPRVTGRALDGRSAAEV